MNGLTIDSLAALERTLLIDGLLKEELNRFQKISKLSAERVAWENKHAHVEVANEIFQVLQDLTRLATRRESLERQNEQTKHS